MNQLFEVQEPGVILNVNSEGETEYVGEGELKVVHDTHGSARVQKIKNNLICEAVVPGSSSPVRFRFKIGDDHQIKAASSPIMLKDVTDLRALFWQTREELNGKL